MAALVVEVISLLTLYYTSLTSGNNSLTCDYHGNCLCPEDVLTFVCSVSDGAATIWRGSFFTDCPDTGGREIILRHHRFDIGSYSASCNDGAVIAYSTEVTNNSYTSQLNVTISPDLDTGTVECVQDSFQEISVGTCTVTVIFAIEPPDNVHVSAINPNQFTIDWSPPASNCPVTTYEVATTDCGVCPNITSNTSIRCTNLMINGQVCSVLIGTIVCGNSYEHSNVANVTIVLKAPSAPNVIARWTNRLGPILTSFNETERFFISNGIDGSATNYTITYSDFTSGTKCGSITISTSECISGQCNHMFSIPSDSVCSNTTGIAITVFATSILGDGSSSEPVHLPFLEFNKTFTHGHNQSAIALYSIVGGSSFAVILFLMLVIIILAIFLKKVYTSFQRPTPVYNPETIEPIATSDEMEPISIHNLVQTILDEDKVTESSDVTEECIIYENNFHEIDKALNLDNLLIRIRDQVTPKWYQFGLAVGISKETLDEFSNFPPEECIVEMSDLWLRTNETTVTWRDVADALKKIGCYQLAERILKVYKTGILSEGAAMPTEESSIVSESDDQLDQPPLPPRMYQSTN